MYTVIADARFPFTVITTIMNNNHMQPRACSNSSLRSAPVLAQCFLNQKTGQRQKTLKSLTQSLLKTRVQYKE